MVVPPLAARLWFATLKLISTQPSGRGVAVNRTAFNEPPSETTCAPERRLMLASEKEDQSCDANPS